MALQGSTDALGPNTAPAALTQSPSPPSLDTTPAWCVHGQGRLGCLWPLGTHPCRSFPRPAGEGRRRRCHRPRAAAARCRRHAPPGACPASPAQTVCLLCGKGGRGGKQAANERRHMQGRRAARAASGILSPAASPLRHRPCCCRHATGAPSRCSRSGRASSGVFRRAEAVVLSLADSSCAVKRSAGMVDKSAWMPVLGRRLPRAARRASTHECRRGRRLLAAQSLAGVSHDACEVSAISLQIIFEVVEPREGSH